jgi:hypothetical protein
VDHVRDFYEEIFTDLARTANLEETIVAREMMEHNRIIQRIVGHTSFVANLAHALSLLRTHVEFQPELIIVEGFDLETASAEDVAQLRTWARDANAEVWMSLRTPRIQPKEDWHVLPAALARLADLISVVVLLHPVQDAVRIRLLKDHDNPDVADLTLDLDATTLLVKQR